MTGKGPRREGPAAQAERPLFLGEATLTGRSSSDADAPKADFDLTRERLANVKDSRAGNFAPS